MGSDILSGWCNNDYYFDDLAVFGLGFFHPGGIQRTKKFLLMYDWENLDVLDVGCGNGTTLALLEHYGARVYGIESSRLMYLAAINNGIERERIALEKIENVSPEARKFDFIVIEGVLGFIEDPCSVLNRLKSSLKQNGHIIILDWEPHQRRLNLQEAKNYGFYVYGKTKSKYIKKHLEGLGFNVSENIEDSIARSFTLSKDAAELRVKSFFGLQRINNNVRQSINRKLAKMKKILSEDIACKSYLLIAESVYAQQGAAPSPPFVLSGTS